MADLVFFKDLPLDITVTSQGDISEVTNAESVKQSLRMITETAKGTRIFFPQFGARIKAYLFEPFDEDTSRRIGEDLQTTISNFEKRISIIGIDIQMDHQTTEYDINVKYRINSTGEVDSLDVSLEKL